MSTPTLPNAATLAYESAIHSAVSARRAAIDGRTGYPWQDGLIYGRESALRALIAQAPDAVDAATIADAHTTLDETY